jgi:5-methylcytosine-specific restriction endonuclease McrA
MAAMQSRANTPDMWHKKGCAKEQNGRWLPDRASVKSQRTMSELKRWRKAVFERDGYTCRHCDKVGGKLNAHHIKSYRNFPELREVLENGLTLCVECHKKTDNYGEKAHAILL